MTRHGRGYYALRGIVRLVVLGGGLFFALAVLPAIVDHFTF